ncbi:MAG: GGDEF domain-containing protein [Acidobacteria bacterium]|nr:GGDEF domain-containing protein [Acidobacteriota bacterium]
MGQTVPEDHIRTEYLRLKAAVYDPNTHLQSVAAVVDAVRGFFDSTRWVGVVHIEIDAFARVESIYGWQVYDRLLRAVSAVLHESRGEIFPRESVLAQNGIYGGQFVVFAPAAGESRAPLDALERTARALSARLAERFGGPEFHSMAPPLTFHVGYAAFADRPFHRLERLIYRTIEEARRLAFQGEPDRKLREQAELKRIIADGDIEIVFQPVLDLRSSRTVGYEAFCRGPRDTVFERPQTMFDGARDAGASRDLDLLCHRKALHGAKSLGPGDMLFLNALPASLSDPSFVDNLNPDGASGSGVRSEKIILEFADRNAIADYELFGVEIQELRALGYRVAVDNVGTGSSSLQTITEVRPDFIKVDCSLIRNIQTNLVKQELLRSLCQVARSIEASVIAQGIELKEELDAVRNCGTDFGQGFLFAFPARDLPTAKPEI